MESEHELRNHVDQLRHQVELLGRMIGETIPGANLVPTGQTAMQNAHEVRRVVMDPPGTDRVLGAIEQQVIIDPQTRERVLQTTLHYSMSWDGRVIRDQANVYQCGICHRQALVEPKFCHVCNIPLCSLHTKTSSRGEIRCDHH